MENDFELIWSQKCRTEVRLKLDKMEAEPPVGLETRDEFGGRFSGVSGSVFIFGLRLLKSSPGGRYPNSEVAAAVLNGASRLQYTNPPQARTNRRREQGDRSAYFLKTNEARLGS